MTAKNFILVASSLFALVALSHLVRFMAGIPVQFGDTDIPLWASIVGALVAGGLSAWGFSVAGARAS